MRLGNSIQRGSSDKSRELCTFKQYFLSTRRPSFTFFCLTYKVGLWNTRDRMSEYFKNFFTVRSIALFRTSRQSELWWFFSTSASRTKSRKVRTLRAGAISNFHLRHERRTLSCHALGISAALDFLNKENNNAFSAFISSNWYVGCVRVLLANVPYRDNGRNDSDPTISLSRNASLE